MAATNFNHLTTKWPNGIIPYYFHESFKKDLRNSANSAIEKIESTQLIKFVEIKDINNYLDYYLSIESSNPGNFATLGKNITLKKSILNLNSGFLALHELCHVVGLIHEQCRSDRDYYIDVCYENIYNGINNHNFSKIQNSQNLTMYDFNSVMHYPAPAKGWESINKDKQMRTMINKLDYDKSIGVNKKWEDLTTLDYIGLRKIYLAKTKIYSIKNMENDSYRNDHATKMQGNYERIKCDFEFEYHDDRYFSIRNMYNNCYLDHTITSMNNRVNGDGELWSFEEIEKFTNGDFKAYIKNKKNGKYLTKHASKLADHAKKDEIHFLTYNRVDHLIYNEELVVESSI